MSNTDWDSYEFRYVAARGVESGDKEFPNIEPYWDPVTPDDLASMDAATLRRVADAMDGGRGSEIELLKEWCADGRDPYQFPHLSPLSADDSSQCISTGTLRGCRD